MPRPSIDYMNAIGDQVPSPSALTWSPLFMLGLLMIWIPFWQWHSWTPEQRGQITSYYESIGQKWAIDLKQDKPPNPRISDFEEYEGEATDRGFDNPRGYLPLGPQTSVGKRS